MLIIAGIVVAVLVVAVVLAMITFRRVVPTNMTHIVQSSKTTTPYGKGQQAGNTYYEWPSFLPLIGVTVTQFPESIFPINLFDYEAYDTARLPFVIDAAAFFRVRDPIVAAQRVSNFSELQKQLTSVLQGSVRRILATSKLEEIMQERSKFGDQFTQEVDEQISEWGVVSVKTIEFMDIRDSRDSQVIRDIMEKEKSRIDRESRIAVAENEKEASLKEIDAQQVVDVSRQEAEQKVGVRTAEKVQAIRISEEQAKQQVADQQKVTAERDMAVKQVNDVRTAEIQRDVAAVNAEQQKQVAVIAANADKETQITRAQGELESANLDAQGIRSVGTAKADAEKAMLMAPVDAQITLAKEIGENDNYQQYLVTIRQVEAQQAIGIEMAHALEKADLKVISNSGDVVKGVAGLGDILSSAGGTKIAALLEGLSQTEAGKALVQKVTAPAKSDD